MTNLKIKLEWKDPIFNEMNEFEGTLPITIGRNGSGAMVSLESGFVSTNHAYLKQEGHQLVLVDLGSRNGTAVNNQPITQPTELNDQDMLQIGPYAIKIAVTEQVEPGRQFKQRPFSNPVQSFPPSIFENNVVAMADLRKETAVETTTYLAIGGGLGSFTWVDHLRIFGVAADQIVSIGFEEKPYGRYKRLCENSQIPEHERLRSNSDSCPDNIWGWPGYGVREIWQSATAGQLGNAAKVGWKLFNEPLVETYTPKAGNVFDSVDREADRIGWSKIWRKGRVRAIRKTDDGRYVVAYTHMPKDGPKQHRLIVAKYIHLAVGYPGVRFLPDLQKYRQNTGDFTRVVNAYEEHEHVYKTLAERGGVVMIRGRGIVASRILQRIYETRQKTNQKIGVLHLMRSPNGEGNSYNGTQREVKNHWEFQPFNWPKAAWGGDLRELLAEASPEESQSLYSQWGGTTTADRLDWRDMVEEGLQAGWYEIQFGDVDWVEQDGNGRLALNLQGKGNIERETTLNADYIIDATGLDSSVRSNALLADLIDTYDLPLNNQGRFEVNPCFELEMMRQPTQHAGRIYASGVITLGSHYAPVDSFLGLQYAALQSVDDLTQISAPSVRHINGARSVTQWTRWAVGATP